GAQGGRVIWIRDVIGDADFARSWTEREVDCLNALTLVHWRLFHGHAGSASGGNFAELRALRQTEKERAAGTVVGDRRIRVVLDVVFLADFKVRARGLKNDRARRDGKGADLICGLEDLNVGIGGARWNGLVIVHALIDGAQKHWRSAKHVIGDGE